MLRPKLKLPFFESLFRRPEGYITIGVGHTAHGTVILQALLDADIRPVFALVMAESEENLCASARLINECSKWYFREPKPPAYFGIDEEPLSIAAVYHRYGIPYIFVKDYNNPAVRKAVRQSRAACCLLAEAPIIRQPFLSLFSAGVINFHAASLPEYRGSWATRWNLYNDDPLNVSAHLVEPGVDTGNILMIRQVFPKRGDTMRDVDCRAIEVAAKMAVELMPRMWTDYPTGVPQETWQGTTYRGDMPEDIQSELERRLREEAYSFYDK